MIIKTSSRYFVIALLFFLFNILSASFAATKNVITVVGITNNTPVEYNSGSNSPVGLYVELWKLWSKKTGISVKYIITTPGEAEELLKTDKIDVIMGYHPAITKNNFAVSEEIYHSDFYIYRNNKISSAETLTEIKPYRTGITDHEKENLKKINSGINLLIRHSVRELIEASEMGEINVFIADASLANHLLKESGLWRKFTQSSEPVFTHGISAAVKAGNSNLLEQINSGFKKFTETEILVVERTWAGGNFKYRIPWGFIVSIIVIITVLIGVAAVWWWNYQLHRKINLATKELTKLKEEAESANIAKSRFLDNISHELRTPLTLILAPVEEAMKGEPLKESSLEMIQRNSRNLLSLINDLLDISRITAGMMILKVTETDLCTAVRFYCAEMDSASEYRGIELKCTLPDKPATAFIDQEKFSRIISNFFSNSFKFTERGGLINLCVESNSQNIVLKFIDNGKGISSSKIETIFNRFSQADLSEIKNYEGTGIGLAIVKEIAELHGATVSVKSRHIDEYPDDHGTEFTLAIPRGKDHLSGRRDVEFCEITKNKLSIPFARGMSISPDKHPAPETNSISDISSDDLPSILIVEDNADMRSFLKLLLADNYFIHSASNGIEALEILKLDDGIDLIVSDVMMPEMDGHEFIKQLQSDERFSGIPTLFLTARGDDFMKHEGLELGAADYVTKPFNSDELKLRIRNQINLKAIRNSLQRKNDELSAKLRQHMENRKNSSNEDAVKKIELICTFIKEHFTDDLNRENLASASEMNPDTFSRMFNKYTGCTLSDYIAELRIGEAKRRLSGTDDPITRICMDTGFDSIRTFNRAFRKFTGKTPREFRESMPE